jgi:hypothetical protein
MQIERPRVAGGVTVTSLPKGYLARHGETAWAILQHTGSSTNKG